MAANMNKCAAAEKSAAAAILEVYFMVALYSSIAAWTLLPFSLRLLRGHRPGENCRSIIRNYLGCCGDRPMYRVFDRWFALFDKDTAVDILESRPVSILYRDISRNFDFWLPLEFCLIRVRSNRKLISRLLPYSLKKRSSNNWFHLTHSDYFHESPSGLIRYFWRKKRCPRRRFPGSDIQHGGFFGYEQVGGFCIR